MRHGERHHIHRAGWLRAFVLGANDGIVSIGALVLGMAGSGATPSTVLVAGGAGLVGGALSMALGEYVSVSSQRDLERADIALEQWELEHRPEAELAELVAIWRARGLSPDLARKVADALHAHDALEAHLRDELGISSHNRARPVQAALASAAAFSVGGGLPVLLAAAVPGNVAVVAAASLVTLAGLGWLSARLGGASPLRATARVVVGGAAALALTWALGAAFGLAV